MNITDTHSHLDVADFDLERDDVIELCRSLGISKIIIPAIESKTWSNVLDLCQSNKDLYPTLGLHPVFIEQHQVDDINKLEQFLEKASPAANGAMAQAFANLKNKVVFLLISDYLMPELITSIFSYQRLCR